MIIDPRARVWIATVNKLCLDSDHLKALANKPVNTIGCYRIEFAHHR